MPTAQATATGQLDLLSLLGNFLLVIVLLVAVLWLLRRVQGIKGLQGLRPMARRLAVVEALSVGPRQKLAIIRMDERELLVGVTPTGFTLLAGSPEGFASSGTVPAEFESGSRPSQTSADVRRTA